MVTGVPPFTGENIKKLSECIMFDEPDYELKPIKYQYALKDLLKRMLYSFLPNRDMLVIKSHSLESL